MLYRENQLDLSVSQECETYGAIFCSFLNKIGELMGPTMKIKEKLEFGSLTNDIT
jgi:hypothetical protein